MPKVKKNTLILITGIIWLYASFALLSRAYSWIEILTLFQFYIGLAIAFPLAIVKIYFIFNKLTVKNIKRIQSFKQKKISIWEFHIAKDKILIILMVFFGIILRHTPFIPKYVLFPIYIGIGIAMFYVWILYLKTFLKVKNSSFN